MLLLQCIKASIGGRALTLYSAAQPQAHHQQYDEGDDKQGKRQNGKTDQLISLSGWLPCLEHGFFNSATG